MRTDAPVLAVISIGGGLGALSRHLVTTGWPTTGGFGWATWTVNISGCLLIGVLMALVNSRPTHRLLRPFLGVGLLGGYTTFSTFAVEFQRAVGETPVAALLYLFATPPAALTATMLGMAAYRRLAGPRGAA